MFKVVLKNLKHPEQIIVLDEHATCEGAEQLRKNWRTVLGGKNWTVNRRPGLDTLHQLALSVEP